MGERFIYLDHAATTAVSPAVLEKMLPYYAINYGNPSSVYSIARTTKKAVDEARESVAAAFGAKPNEIYFTGSGSEADNWAIKGAMGASAYSIVGASTGTGVGAGTGTGASASAAVGTSASASAIVGTGASASAAAGTSASASAIVGTGASASAAVGVCAKKHIITSSIEHHAVLDTCAALERQGFRVTYLPVDEYGLVSPDDLSAAIRDDTALVSIMAANNEIGTVQPIKELAAIAKSRGILFHTDAVQAAGSLPLNVAELGVDMMSIAAHKFYGPKGVGALYIKAGTKIDRFMHGGSQERGRRAGTENVAGIVGLAEALRIAVANIDGTNAKLCALRDRTIKEVLEKIPHARLNGHPTRRLPNNANFAFRFIEGESLLLMLDMKGIGASSGSACTSGSLDPSHVLLAIGLSHEIAHGSLRITFGVENTDSDVDCLMEVLPPIVGRLRDMSPLYDDFVKSGK